MLPSLFKHHQQYFGVLIALAIILVPIAALSDETDTSEPPGVEVVVEPDAYYSNVGVFVPLTDEPIPDINITSEIDIYRQLLLTSWPPRFFLAELSVDPLPALDSLAAADS